jgi:hypothetical protein
MQEAMEVEEEEEEDDLEAMMRKYREKEEKESKPTALLLVIPFLFFVLAWRPHFLIFKRSLYLIPESCCRYIEAYFQQMNYRMSSIPFFLVLDPKFSIPDSGSSIKKIPDPGSG